MYKIFIILFLANSVFAVKYWDGFSGIKTPELSNTLVKAKKAFKNKQHQKAEDLIDKALLMKNAQEFKIIDDANGPLAMQLKASKAHYIHQSAIYRRGDSQLIKSVYKIFDDYCEISKEKSWPAYASLYQILLGYYAVKGEQEKARQELENMFEYDGNQIGMYAIWGLEIKLPLFKVEEKIKLFEKKGGVVSGELNFLRVRYKIRDTSNAVQAVISHLKKFPVNTLYNINVAFDYLNENLKLDTRKDLIEYRDFLIWLAVNQSADKQKGQILARILNEKRKVVIRILDRRMSGSKCKKM